MLNQHYLTSSKNVQHFRLSNRERECLFHLLAGKSAKEIGSLLRLSPRTVEYYIANVKVKFNCHTRADLIDFSIKNGFINIASLENI